MSTSNRFTARNGQDPVRLVTENPLAWIFVTDEEGPFVTAVPVRPVVESDEVVKFVSHVPRNQRIARYLEVSPRGLISIFGPHGYISPSWMSDRSQAPTWNFTSVQYVSDIQLVDDREFLERHLRDLTKALEGGRQNAWNVDEMGARFDRLSSRIIAIEATVLHAESRFKLGQDEDDETYREIVRALQTEGRDDLLAWMRAFNPR